MELQRLQRDLAEWLSTRKKIWTLLKHMMNMQSRTTFVTTDRLESAGLDNALVNSADFNVAMFDDLQKASQELVKLQAGSIDLMEKLACQEAALSETTQTSIHRQPIDDSASMAAIDMELVRQVTKQVQKQQLLEMHVIAKVMDSVNFDSGASPIGHDEAVTLLACFAYPPYLIMSDVNALQHI